MTLRDRLRYSIILSIVLSLAAGAILIDSAIQFNRANRDLQNVNVFSDSAHRLNTLTLKYALNPSPDLERDWNTRFSLIGILIETLHPDTREKIDQVAILRDRHREIGRMFNRMPDRQGNMSIDTKIILNTMISTTELFTSDADQLSALARAEMDRMQIRSVISIIFLIILFVGQFAALAFYLRGVYARINELSLTAIQITRGNLNASKTILSGSDEVGALGASFRQMTESLIETNRILQQRENRLNSLLTAIPDLIFIIDAEGIYQDVFTAYPEFLAVPREDLIGKHISDVFPLEISIPMINVMHLALASGEMQEHEYSIQTLSGINTFQARMIAFDDGGAKRILWLARDVTVSKQAEQELLWRIDELEVLNQVGEILVSNSDTQTLMDRVGDHLRKIFNVTIAYIALLDPQTNLFHYSYFEDEHIDVTPVPYGRGLSSYVMETRRPLLINNDWERVAAEHDVINPEGRIVKSWLGVPMIIGERPIGLITVVDSSQENAFNDSDVRLLTTIASNVAVSLENARLFSLAQEELFERKRAESELQRRMTELEAINSVSQALIATADLPSLLTYVGTQIHKVFDVPITYIALYDAENDIIDFPYYYYDSQRIDTPPARLGKGLTSHIIKTRQPLLINANWDVEAEKYHVIRNGTGSVKASLGVPMIVSDQILGVISIQDPVKENAFTEADVNLLMTIASNLGVAIENSRLYIVAQQELQERRRVEVALRSSEEMYRHAIAAAGAVPYTIDYRMNAYTFLGDEIEKITGYSPGELTPQKFEAITQESYMQGELSEYSTARAIELVRAGILHTKIWQSDFRILTKSGGTRWLSDASIQVAGADGKVASAIGILQDITERKSNEEKIRRMNEELEERVQQRTNQLQAVIHEMERFSYTVSHDLRAPLRAVHGYSRIIETDFGKRLPKKVLEHIEKIQISARTMGKLIDDLLAFIRLGQQPVRKMLIPMNELFRESFEQLRSEYGEREIHFILRDLPPCYADPEFMKPVVVNLLSNAIKFTSHQPQAVIEVGAEKHLTRVTYYVKDNGVGFDMQYVHKLFGVFQRLHAVDEFEGTGAGLAMVQRIIQKHGGNVHAEGVVGQGATFYFTLPTKEQKL